MTNQARKVLSPPSGLSTLPTRAVDAAVWAVRVRRQAEEFWQGYEPCCAAMRNAVINRAISLHNGKPEVVGEGTEETNVHFPLRCCPFCRSGIEQ